MNFLKILLAAIVAFAVVELAMDALYHRPATIQTDHGHVFRENTTYRNVILHEGFSIYPVQNEFGTYGRINRSKPIVLAIGDSFTTGLEVLPNKNYVSLLGQEFPETQFVNAGILGTAIPEQILNKQYYETYEPKLYILQVNAFDFTTNPLESSNKYRFDANLSVIPNSPTESEASRIRSHLYRLNLGHSQVFHTIITRTFDGSTSTPKQDNFNIAGQMALLKQTYGDKLIILFVPNTPRLAGNGVYFTDNAEEAYREILAAAATEEIPVVDLTEPYLTYYNQTKQLPFGFADTKPGAGHWNSEGQAIAAREVAKYLRETNALH